MRRPAEQGPNNSNGDDPVMTRPRGGSTKPPDSGIAL
jgi:hypothetical protein